ncbi:MAG: succinyl-diaminopimelate desuccinylase [Acidimicrobiales bacterium]|nr:MAG: succinyl-diaminopimelate desuccinylase [Acidimicrobiales bacterium]
MSDTIPDLDLCADPVQLTAALVDIPSVSGGEAAIADAVEAALGGIIGIGDLTITRDGDAIVACTSLGRNQRIILAGHLDTVPIAKNLPSRRQGDLLYGCGSSDMKAGVAVLLHVAATLVNPRYDLTLVLYDHEEVSSDQNGLGRLMRHQPQLFAADAAIVLEPTAGQIEAGCQGVLRVTAHTTGQRAHAARSWLGSNAIHAAGSILTQLGQYRARSVSIDGCTYRESLSAVGISGGIAGNVIPDACQVELSFRYAPDRSSAQALAHVQELFAGYRLTVLDEAPAALPGLNAGLLRRFVAHVDAPVVAKYGWTDVARFAEQGVPALNFGPGDPSMAHQLNECVDVGVIRSTATALRGFLSSSA